MVSVRRTAVDVRPIANGASAPSDGPPWARHAARRTPAVLAWRGDGAITTPPPDGSVTVPSGTEPDAGTVVTCRRWTPRTAPQAPSWFPRLLACIPARRAVAREVTHAS